MSFPLSRSRNADLCRGFVRRLPLQYPPRIVVHPVLDGSYPLFADLGEVRTLGKETAYHAVMVLYAALLPRGIAMTVPYLKAAAAVYALA